MGDIKNMGEDLQDHHIADLLSRGLNLKKKNGKHYLVTKTVTPPRRVHEQDDDIAILTMILPGEKFECNLKKDCLLGNSKESKLGKHNAYIFSILYSLLRKMYCRDNQSFGECRLNLHRNCG